MGVEGLWKLVERAAQTKSLYRAAVERKVITSYSMKLGVDISTIMCECIAAAAVPSLHGQLQGGGIYVLFNKLRIFMQCPCVFIFVFDGPNRPPLKRGIYVDTSKRPSWQQLAEELVRYSGFRAPGEAEAKLSRMNALGVIDAVVTSDSDALVFGATRIFRSVPSSTATFPLEFTVYEAAKIQERVSLSRGGILLVALLCGGDYDDGLEGCGPAIAYGLAQVGFGDQLLKAVNENNVTDDFLAKWRAELQEELSTNAHGKLHNRQPHLASRIGDDFPKQEIINLYCNPITSWSDWIVPQGPPDILSWGPKEPNIPLLKKFCYETFGWRTPDVLKQKFDNLLWEGAFAQMLFSSLVCYDPKRKVFATPNVNVEVLGLSFKSRKGKWASTMGDEPVARFVISTTKFVALMGEAFDTGKDDKAVVVWVDRRLIPDVYYTAGNDPSTSNNLEPSADGTKKGRSGNHTSETQHSLRKGKGVDRQAASATKIRTSSKSKPRGSIVNAGFLDMTVPETDQHWMDNQYGLTKQFEAASVQTFFPFTSHSTPPHLQASGSGITIDQQDRQIQTSTHCDLTGPGVDWYDIDPDEE